MGDYVLFPFGALFLGADLLGLIYTYCCELPRSNVRTFGGWGSILACCVGQSVWILVWLVWIFEVFETCGPLTTKELQTMVGASGASSFIVFFFISLRLGFAISAHWNGTRFEHLYLGTKLSLATDERSEA